MISTALSGGSWSKPSASPRAIEQQPRRDDGLQPSGSVIDRPRDVDDPAPVGACLQRLAHRLVIARQNSLEVGTVVRVEITAGQSRLKFRCRGAVESKDLHVADIGRQFQDHLPQQFVIGVAVDGRQAIPPARYRPAARRSWRCGRRGGLPADGHGNEPVRRRSPGRCCSSSRDQYPRAAGRARGSRPPRRQCAIGRLLKSIGRTRKFRAIYARNVLKNADAG